MVEVYHLPNDYDLSVNLFENVSNSGELKQMAINGEINVALLTPSMVLDEFQLLIAANKALHNFINEKLTTKTLHSELLFCLSPTRGISAAFQKFGMQNNDKEVLIVEIHPKHHGILSELQTKVSGRSIPLSSLKNYTNSDIIKKTYKITEAELKIGSLLDAVVTRISTKDLVTF